MLKRYIYDNRGSMAVISALGATSLLVVAGAAIELSALTKSKDKLQDAADSAVLAAAISIDSEKKEREKIAEDAAKANFNDDFMFKINEQDTQITVELSSKYETVLMGMFGYEAIPITAVAGSEVGTGGKLNIALALDTTLSMEGSRMNGLIAAATDLVESVERADKGQGNAKIALVPFADYVRIDTAYDGEPWIDVADDREVEINFIDMDNSTNCRQEVAGEIQSTVCDDLVTYTETVTVTWVGCMGSRPNDLHKTGAFDGSPFKGLAGSSACDEYYNTMVPLTSEFDEIEGAIEGLTARGRTYLPAGLQWAWRSLTEESLFTDERVDEETEVQNILVLMTDGSNTVNLGGEVDGFDGIYHWGTDNEDEDREKADALTLEMCESIKSADIRLITVAYEVSDNDTKDMLKTCASKGSDFYDARDAAKLKTAFGKIGSGFSSVRLTR